MSTLSLDIRTGSLESFDPTDSYGHLLQKVSWLVQPMSVPMNQHLQTLAAYPPVQGETSFDMSKDVEDVMKKGLQ